MNNKNERLSVSPKEINTDKSIPGRIIVAPVGGTNQRHENPVQNSSGYTQALEGVFAKYGI